MITIKSPTSLVLLECLTKLREIHNAIVDYRENHEDYEDCIDKECWEITNNICHASEQIGRIAGHEIIAETFYDGLKTA